MKYIYILLLSFIAVLTEAQAPTIYATDACGESYTGSVEVTFTHDIASYPLPYTGSYYNETSGDYEEITITTNPVVITDLFPGEYTFQLDIGSDMVMQFCAEVISHIVSPSDLYAVSSADACYNECNGSISIIIDESNLGFGWTFPFSLEVEELGTGDITTYPINAYEYTIENVCIGNYHLSLSTSSLCQYAMEVEVLGSCNNCDWNISSQVTHTNNWDICQSGAIDFTLHGGNPPWNMYISYSYGKSGSSSTYSLPPILSLSGLDGREDLTNLQSGIYNITFVDRFGCSKSESIEVQCECRSIYPFLGSTPTTCNYNDGSIYIIADRLSMPNTPYFVTIYDGSGSAVHEGYYSAPISGLRKGSYSIEIVDNTGCKIEDTDIYINGPDPFEVYLSVAQNVTDCHDDYETCDGSIELSTTTSALHPWNYQYTYLWSNGAATKNVDELCSGEHTVTVTYQGCSQVLSQNICCCQEITEDHWGTSTYTAGECYPNSSPSPLIIDIDPLILNGVVNATVTGGTGDYSCKWYNKRSNWKIYGENCSQVTLPNESGEYCLEVKDGCEQEIKCFDFQACPSGSQNYNNLALEVDIPIEKFVPCEAKTINNPFPRGQIVIDIINGINPQIQWSTGENTNKITVSESGTYTVTVTDGCTVVEKSINFICDEVRGSNCGALLSWAEKKCFDKCGDILEGKCSKIWVTASGYSSLEIIWPDGTKDKISGGEKIAWRVPKAGYYCARISSPTTGCVQDWCYNFIEEENVITKTDYITNRIRFGVARGEYYIGCGSCITKCDYLWPDCSKYAPFRINPSNSLSPCNDGLVTISCGDGSFKEIHYGPESLVTEVYDGETGCSYCIFAPGVLVQGELPSLIEFCPDPSDPSDPSDPDPDPKECTWIIGKSNGDCTWNRTCLETGEVDIFEVETVACIQKTGESCQWIEWCKESCEVVEQFEFVDCPPIGEDLYCYCSRDGRSNSDLPPSVANFKWDVLITPNPAKNIVDIYSTNTEGNTSTFIYNSDGRLATQITFNKKIHLNIAEYPSGTYNFIFNYNGNVKTKKIVKI